LLKITKRDAHVAYTAMHVNMVGAPFGGGPWARAPWAPSKSGAVTIAFRFRSNISSWYSNAII